MNFYILTINVMVYPLKFLNSKLSPFQAWESDSNMFCGPVETHIQVCTIKRTLLKFDLVIQHSGKSDLDLSPDLQKEKPVVTWFKTST